MRQAYHPHMNTTTAPAQAATKRCPGAPKHDIQPHEAPMEEFAADRTSKDGHVRVCRACFKRYMAALKAAKASAATAIAALQALPPEQYASETVDHPADWRECAVPSCDHPAHWQSDGTTPSVTDDPIATKREAARLRMAALRASRKAAQA